MSNATEHDTIFEQPIHEHIRTFLRIEHLQKQANHFIDNKDTHHDSVCLMTMLELLQLLDRPDLRSRFTQELSRQLINLERLQDTPTIDHSKLNTIIQRIENYLRYLHENNGKFIANLRNNEFIKVLMQQSSIPGGTCSHNAPGFHLWLDQKAEVRQAHLHSWLKEFDEIFSISELMLKTIRDTSTFMSREASQGFFQMPLDPTVPCQLIRVAIPSKELVFPSISVGRHGLNIRYLEADMKARATKTKRTIHFKLACCIF